MDLIQRNKGGCEWVTLYRSLPRGWGGGGGDCALQLRKQTVAGEENNAAASTEFNSAVAQGLNQVASL